VVHSKWLGLFRQPWIGSTLSIDRRTISPVNTTAITTNAVTVVTSVTTTAITMNVVTTTAGTTTTVIAECEVEEFELVLMNHGKEKV
jgi:hypothetical protein